MAKNVLLVLVLSLLTVSSTISSELEQKSLADIAGMHLIVEPLGNEALETGLSQEKLKTDAEQKLRLAKIEVDPKFGPHINILINCAFPKSASGQEMGYIAMVQVEFNQEIYVLENFHRMYAPTWESSILIWGSKSGFENDARKRVRDLMDQFINDYLAANPKK